MVGKNAVGDVKCTRGDEKCDREVKSAARKVKSAAGKTGSAENVQILRHTQGLGATSSYASRSHQIPPKAT